MEQQISYKYSKIDLEQFAMFEEDFVMTNEVQFQTEARFSFDISSNMLCSKILVLAYQLDKLVLKADLCSYFDIMPESIDSLRQNEKIVFYPMLLVQFASLCYGSMRGVIYAKTIGSPINSLVLPPVFWDKIIDKSFVI